MGAHTISNAGFGQALVAIRRLVRTLRTSATAVERSLGISSAQLFALQTLNEGPVGSVNELASQTMTDQSSVSVVVTRLEAQGLVSRAHSPHDARRMMISITPAGQRLVEDAPDTVQKRLLAALRQLSPDARQHLTMLLEEITTHLGATHEPATFLFEDDATGAH